MFELVIHRDLGNIYQDPGRKERGLQELLY